MLVRFNELIKYGKRTVLYDGVVLVPATYLALSTHVCQCGVNLAFNHEIMSVTSEYTLLLLTRSNASQL